MNRSTLQFPGSLLLVLVVFFSGIPTIPAEEVPADRLLLLSRPARYEVIRGEVFSIEVFLDRTTPEEVVLELPVLPEGIEIEGVPVLITRAGGVVEARIEGVARRAGRFVIDPILIETATGPWFVPRLLVEAAPARGERVPFGARWRPLQDPVFQGQSVPVVLEISGIDTFTFPEGISVRSPQTGLFEETSGIGSVISESVAGVELYQIPVAVFLFTTTSAGDVVLPPAEVEALGITATAPALTLDVLPLPPAVESTGAVGSFTLAVNLDRSTILAGETVQLEIILEGAGNFPVLDMPALALEGLRVVDQIDGGEVQADTETLLGYRGTRTRIVRLEPDDDAERGIIRVERFSFFDPDLSRVVTTTSRIFEIEIPAEGGGGETGRLPPQLELLTTAELQQLRWYRILDLQWPLLLFLLGPAVFAVNRLLSVRRSGGVSGPVIAASLVLFTSAAILPQLDQQRLNRAEDLVRSGGYAVAGVLYDLELQRHPNHAGLHYNRGVLAVRSDNTFAAVFHLRRAARLSPENTRFRGALEDAMRYFELTDQIALPPAVRPDLFILLLLVLWSGFWLLLLARSALTRSISLVSLVMIGVITAAALFWSMQVALQPEGIVRQELTVRRIPDYSAGLWVQLYPVTTVEIELSYDDFYLVRTASGVTGWVPQNGVRRFGVNR